MIPRTDLYKLLKKSGAPRIGGLMYEETRYILRKITKRVVENGSRPVQSHRSIVSKKAFAKFVHTYNKDLDMVQISKIQLNVEHKITSILKKAYINTKKDGRKTLQPRDLKVLKSNFILFFLYKNKMSETINYFDSKTDIKWIMNQSNILLSEQFTFCLEECNKFVADNTYDLQIDLIRHKCSMLAAYYMFTNKTFSIDIFRLTYCLRHIEDHWKENDLDIVSYLLYAVTFGIQDMINTLKTNNM